MKLRAEQEESEFMIIERFLDRLHEMNLVVLSVDVNEEMHK